MKISEIIAGALCLGLPVIAMVVFLVLIRFDKRPAQREHSDPRHGFPIEPAERPQRPPE